MSRRSSRAEPHRVRCMNCGSYQTTYESEQDGTPLCEDHDSDKARTQYRLKRRIDNLSDALNDLNFRLMEAHQRNDCAKTQQLESKKENLQSKLSTVRDKLNELQKNCDHENANRDERTITEDDLDGAPPDVLEDAPFTETYIRCHDCGHEEVQTG